MASQHVFGRLLTVDNDGTPGVPNVILTSAYDANGNRTSLAAEIDATDDFLSTYTYDNLHRLTRVDQAGQTGGNTGAEERVDFTYNKLGQYTQLARFNDTAGGTGDEVATSHYTYDSLNRLTDLAYKNGGTNLFTPYEWTYDSLSNLLPVPLAGAASSSLPLPVAERRGEGRSFDPRLAALAQGAVFGLRMNNPLDREHGMPIATA